MDDKSTINKAKPQTQYKKGPTAADPFSSYLMITIL